MKFLRSTLCMIALAIAPPAIADAVVSSEFVADKAGYPCFVTMTTASGTQFTTQLSDYKDVWSLNFFLSGKPQAFLPFFGPNGFQDDDALKAAVRDIVIGGSRLDISEVNLYEIQRSKVDFATALSVSIETEHRVAEALAAMKTDGIDFAALASLTGTANAYREFLTCAYDSIGLQEGETVVVDLREEYRLAFEKAFILWVSAANRADSCLTKNLDRHAVEDVIERASSAFYPGLTNMFQRGRYEDELRRQQTFAQLDGRTDAVTDGCALAGQMADVSEKLVVQALDSAETLD